MQVKVKYNKSNGVNKLRTDQISTKLEQLWKLLYSRHRLSRLNMQVGWWADVFNIIALLACTCDPFIIHLWLLVCAFDVIYTNSGNVSCLPESLGHSFVYVLRGPESPTLLPDLINPYRPSPWSQFPFFSPYLCTHPLPNLLSLAQNSFLAEWRH